MSVSELDNSSPEDQEQVSRRVGKDSDDVTSNRDDHTAAALSDIDEISELSAKSVRGDFSFDLRQIHSNISLKVHLVVNSRVPFFFGCARKIGSFPS